MRNILLVIGAVAFLSTAGIAGPNSHGAYVGAGYGNSAYGDADFVQEALGRVNLEETDTGYKVYGGYQFNNVIGIEVGYNDYGTATASQEYSQAAKSFNVAANLGYSFLDGQLRPFATLGLGVVSLDWQNLPAYYTSLNDTAGAFHYGLGIQYEPDFLIGFGLRLAYEVDTYAINISGFNGTTFVDETYIQTLGLAYMGVQYKF